MMVITTIAIDVAKDVFGLHGVDAQGRASLLIGMKRIDGRHRLTDRLGIIRALVVFR